MGVEIFTRLYWFLEPEEVVIFVNAGDETSREADSNMKFLADTFFQGGDVLRTEECITEGGDCPFIYQSARLGNFSYRFENLHPGDYFVDLHFVEIINTDGPKGMRVFNVFVQEEKASELEENLCCDSSLLWKILC